LSVSDLKSKSNQALGLTHSQYTSNGLYAWIQASEKASVAVVPEYLPERSSPSQLFFSYAYHVTITNTSDVSIQLLSRTWIITDGSGYVETIEGDGVVGEQPWIKPGRAFEYSSGCPLRTPTGNMRGWYHFKCGSGSNFSVRIPLFFLRPDSLRR
jgi:ApaG protein